MEYVDTLLIHDVSNPAFLEHKPVLNALDKLKQQKKVRFVGFSTHGNMAEVITAAAATGRWDVIVTSYNFKLSNPEEMNAALHKANEAGIGIIAMKTLAGGGFLDKERTKPINSAAAIKWVLSNPDVHTVIAGMTTFDHLDSNKKILSDITLTNKEKEDILIAGNETGMFCTGCQKCLGNCRQNLPVPDLMRAYMYAYGYSSPQMAYALMGELGTGSSPCINCDICSVDCTKKFNVKERISDVSRLVNVPSDFIV
jgi:predicted aldo/keto reductase-like oxidoreductase